MQTLIDLQDDGTPDEDFEFFDWISNDGAIRRRMVFRDAEWTDSEGNRLGLYDSWEEYELLNIGPWGTATPSKSHLPTY